MPEETKPSERGLSIRAKILLFGLVPTMLLLTLIVSIELYSYYHELHEANQELIQRETYLIASEIERANHEAVTMVQGMALAQQSGMFGRRRESIEYARTVLLNNAHYTGAYIGYEPNADGQDQAALRDPNLPKEAMDASGRFLPYWYRTLTNENAIVLSPLVDMEKSYYYQGVKNRVLRQPEGLGVVVSNGISKFYAPNHEQLWSLKPMITEPYIYEGKYIVEQTYPIMIDGEFKGIAGIDRSLAYLTKYLADRKPFQTADFMLISRRGRVISADFDEEMIAHPIEETPYAQILRNIYLGDGEPTVQLLEDPVRNERYFFSSVRFGTGNWTLVMLVSRAEILKPILDVMRRVLILTSVGALVVVLVVMGLARSISTRISQAVDAARQVAEGDLTVRIRDSEARDEVGELLRSIQSMVQNLNSLIGQVKHSSIQLVSTATQISAAARQQESTVQNFGTSSNQIAAAVKEISATSQELLGTMQDVTNVASDTATVAKTGRSSLGGMEAAMQHLSEATGSISSKLSVISEKAGNIGSVITTITKVADQTNLLSLNAAIEAEKAGEYGLGFGVVAREIRRLADQTAVATLDIEQMVKEMQSSVSTGVMEMEKFAEEVRRGVQETARISSQFGKIIEQVEHLKPRFDDVHEGMQSQSQGAGQISEAMGQLTDSARHSASSVQEFQEATSKLHEAVRLLKEEVSRFKVS
jgi:methyl-accepting chemotaxis protein WspA